MLPNSTRTQNNQIPFQGQTIQSKPGINQPYIFKPPPITQQINPLIGKQQIQGQTKLIVGDNTIQKNQENINQSPLKIAQLQETQKNSESEIDETIIEYNKIQFNKLKQEFDQLNTVHQKLKNEFEAQKTLLNEKVQKIEKLVEFQKLLSFQLHFLSQKDARNNYEMKNQKEVEKQLVNKIDEYRKRDSENQIKIAQLNYQVKQLQEQEQNLNGELEQNKRQIQLLELKDTELNDEIDRLRLLFKNSNSNQFRDENIYGHEIVTQQIKYTPLRLSESENSIKQLKEVYFPNFNDNLIQQLDREIVYLQKQIEFKDAKIHNLTQNNRLHLKKQVQAQYNKFNPFGFIFYAIAKSKGTLKDVQILDSE